MSLSKQPVTIFVVMASVAFGLLLGCLVSDPDPRTASTKLRAALHHDGLPQDQGVSSYIIFRQPSWQRTVWGRACYSAELTTAQQGLCQLPSVWRNCTQGFYLDIGTNTGVQLRKLYNPEQFAGAAILGLYDTTYGADRSHVCAFGIEANPVHSKYLATLNAYFSTASYQGIVIKEAAASIKTGTATFHQDHTNPFEGGASLAQGSWQSKGNTPTSHVTVPTFDLPAFLVGVVRPLVLQIEQETGKRPPVGMKLDVEGEEYALLPAMITNGALCDLAMVYIEPHGADFRVGAGAAVNMTFDDIMTAFNNMRKANPRCDVQVKIMDDETFADAYKTIPLPLGSGIAS